MRPPPRVDAVCRRPTKTLSVEASHLRDSGVMQVRDWTLRRHTAPPAARFNSSFVPTPAAAEMRGNSSL